MPWLPIPSSYIDAGEGPGQIARRDQNAQIPGVPIVYHRTLVDEVARMVAEQVPSGWTSPQPILGTNKNLVGDRNAIYLDAARGGTSVILNGYKVNIAPPGAPLIRVELPNAPLSGQRDDLVFIEAWFIRTEAGRTLKWRVRVAQDVNFTSYPEGLGDPGVLAQDNQENSLGVAYQKYPSQFPDVRDAGLWWAIKPAIFNDPLAEAGLNQQMYRFTWAVPVARIRRYNSAPYDPNTNPNGASPYMTAGPSPRPDGGWSDMIDPVYQVVDLRHKVMFQVNDNEIFGRALADYLTNRLVSNGVFQQKVEALDTVQYISQRTDGAETDLVAIPANIVRQSHFETSTLTSGIADGWGAYSTGSATGTRSMATPAGQVIARTGGPLGDAWGVQASIANVITRVAALQLSYSVFQASSSTILRVELVDTDSGDSLGSHSISSLVANNQETYVAQVLHLSEWSKNITLRVYLVGGSGTVTLNYVDLRPDMRILPVIKVTTGATYSVSLPAGLTGVAEFNPSLSVVWDGSAGTVLTATKVVASNSLNFALSAPPTSANIWLGLGFNYLGNNGLPFIASNGISQAWDNGTLPGIVPGMVLTVDRTSQSRSLTPTQIAMNEPKGRGLKAWNPYYKPNGGVIATVRIPGNGTGTFTLDSTVYGRNILWPLACRVGKEQTGLFTDQTFTSVTRDVNNNFVCVLSNSAVAYTDQDIYVDVITDMPVLVFNNQTNGVSKQVVGRMLRVKVLESATRIVFRAPGEIMGLVDYQACLPIASNGVSVPLSTSVIPDAPVGPTIALTFPSPVAAGTILEVAVVTRQEFYPSSGLALSYAVGTMSKLNEALLDPSEPVTVLCDPVLIAHTKGTGGADTNPDWGSTPFVRDSQLTSAFIALINQTPVKAVIYDIHKSKNRFGSSPLLAGRKVLISELFNNISFKQSTLVEGQPLSTPVPHAMVLATLVSYKGRRLLLVCSEKRVDEKTAIGGAATFSLYEPNGRPLAVQEA